ncbi:MAG: MBL fold metallo-hydrolase [Chloroflexi bacterium]|nr:MBL fold metallo-hydrolase [Chloroflexota bacterium]
MQVADGVFQFKIPMPSRSHIPGGGLRYTLVYAVEIAEGWVVIDAGLNTDEGFQAFQDQMAEAKIAPRDVSVILITHGHADHAGLANRFKELTGAQLAMHRLDARDGHDRTHDGGQSPEEANRMLRRYGVPTAELEQATGGRPHAGAHDHGNAWRMQELAVDMMLEGGEELVQGTGLWTIWTPGHSAGHICLYDEKRKLLFSGDHVLPGITPHVNLFPGEEGNPLALFLEGHRKLKELDVDMVHPAHEHSFPDLGKRVDEMLGHHRDRMDEMLAQVQDGPKTSWEVSSKINWNVASWEKLDRWTRRAALMETLAHLEYMVSAGEMERGERESMVVYGLA